MNQYRAEQVAADAAHSAAVKTGAQYMARPTQSYTSRDPRFRQLSAETTPIVGRGAVPNAVRRLASTPSTDDGQADEHDDDGEGRAAAAKAGSGKQSKGTKRGARKAVGKPEKQARTGSRKDKSLGLLSERFLQMYADSTQDDICLDVVATQLGVERRRIYDIVNVLEGLELIARKAKNRYEWLGYGSLPATLAKFKELAPTQVVRSGSGQIIVTAVASTPLQAHTAQRQERSLGILAQRFVMLLLLEDGRLVTLEDAVGRLICPGTQDTATKNKTRVRRLYDIANVLCSLNLIAKSTILEGKSKKPAFKWNGFVAPGSMPRISVEEHATISSSDSSSANSSPSSADDEDAGSGPTRKRVRKQTIVKALHSTGNLSPVNSSLEQTFPVSRVVLPFNASAQAWSIQNTHAPLTYQPAKGSVHHAENAAETLLFAASAIDAGRMEM
jgi:hypothetical protein